MPKRSVVLVVIAACGGAAARPTPPPSPCDRVGAVIEPGAAADPQGMPGALAAIVVAACKDDGWSQDTIACYVASTRPDEVDLCNLQLTDAQRDGLGRHVKIAFRRLDGIAPDTGEPDCDDYIRHVDVYMACDKVSAPARAAIRRNVEEQAAPWRRLRDPGTPERRRHDFAAACRALTAQLEETAGALGCATED